MVVAGKVSREEEKSASKTAKSNQKEKQNKLSK
jgi:hypothetical protein